MNNNEREYAIVRGKPFISHNTDGHTVILCEETIFEANKGEGVDAVYKTELIVNENPSAAEIFKIRLANPK